MTGTPNPYPAPAPASGGLGTTSLVIGVVIVVIGLVQQSFATFGLPQLVAAGTSVRDVGTLLAVGSMVQAILALVAIGTGAVGIRPSAPRGRLAAAAGLAIGVPTLLSVLVGFSGTLALSIG